MTAHAMNDCLQPYLQCILLSFIHSKMTIGGEFTGPTLATDLNKFAFVYMFLGCTPQDIKDKIVR